MNWKHVVALALATAVTSSVATPASAATRAKTEAAKVAQGKSVTQQRGDGHTRHAQMRRSPVRYGNPFGGAAGSYAFAPGQESYAPGTWHINQNGLPYRVPDDCAYPIGYDSGGAAIFQMFGCHLP